MKISKAGFIEGVVNSPNVAVYEEPFSQKIVARGVYRGPPSEKQKAQRGRMPGSKATGTVRVKFNKDHPSKPGMVTRIPRAAANSASKLGTPRFKEL